MDEQRLFITIDNETFEVEDVRLDYIKTENEYTRCVIRVPFATTDINKLSIILNTHRTWDVALNGIQIINENNDIVWQSSLKFVAAGLLSTYSKRDRFTTYDILLDGVINNDN